MIITITANITDEDAFILATEKGYTPTIVVGQVTNLDGTITGGTVVPNPVSVSDTLRLQYESLVVENATTSFIKTHEKVNGVGTAPTALIKSNVVSSITSTVV